MLEAQLGTNTNSLAPPKRGLEPLGKRRKEFAEGEGPLRAERVGASESLELKVRCRIQISQLFLHRVVAQ